MVEFVVLLSGLFCGQASLVSLARIGDDAPHSAFTDLVRHGEEWVCVFREGAGHVSPDGSIRVLGSGDGKDWRTLARVRMEGVDLRDPKVSVAPGGRLMLLAAGAFPDGQPMRHQTFVWYSGNGGEWTEPREVGEKDVWVWRATWNRGVAYGVGYPTRGAPGVRLYRRESDGSFALLKRDLFDEGEPNEAAIVFEPDGRAVCLLRRDGTGEAAHGVVGVARPPYTEWSWKVLDRQIGGPALLRLPDGRLIAGVRIYQPEVKTVICALEVECGLIRELLTLPSGGDTSYPGLVWHDGLLWVSYYSSHEGKTAVYLAQVKL